MMKIITGVIYVSFESLFHTSYYRWTGDTGSVAIPTQFYSIVIRCKNESVDVNSCAVKDIQALGIVMYHEESNKVSIYVNTL